ncbi:MAG TPA: hypothetical protein P5291_03355, partial [Flavobacteriales bacterium]|nr:hypothetical protein [Flavobacteriales bacterium]
TPIKVTLKKGKHKTQPWTFAIDDIGPGPKVSVRERYATMKTAWKGALRKLKAWNGSYATPQHTATGRAIVRVLGVVLAYLFAGILSAQSLYVDVAAKYGVTYADGSKRIGEKYAAGKDTVSTGLYWAWQRMKNAGMPYATFRASYLGWGIAQDVAWTGEAPNNLKSGYQNTYSFADWSGARGKWKMNRTAQIPRGGMEGASSFWYAGQGGDQGQVATEFVMEDGDWWPGNTTERRLFETPNSGLDGANNYSYNESFRVERILLSGPEKNDGIRRIGLFLRRAGECSWVNQVRANDFSIGIVAYGGVPLTCGTITAFGNNIAGFAGLGTALSTINIFTLSGDDNPVLLLLDDLGYGAPGGTVNAGLLKSEGGITPGHTFRNQVAGYFRGQYSVNVGVVSFANKPPSVPEAMFVLDPKLPGGSNQRSFLNVGSCKGFGYQYLVSNRVTGAKWTSSGDHSACGFEHYASGDGLFTNATGVSKVTGGGPVDPPGTWTCTAWSACASGVQNRTCTCSGTCSTPKPAESQSCTVTPEPTVLAFTPLSPLKDGTVEGVLREARFAVDGDPSSFWISDRSMANGQAVEVSFPSRSVAGVTFSTGRYNNSYPRTYTVDYWTGSAWSRLGSYTGGVTSAATWSAKTTTKIKITCTTANGNWFAINEVVLK